MSDYDYLLDKEVEEYARMEVGDTIHTSTFTSSSKGKSPASPISVPTPSPVSSPVDGTSSKGKSSSRKRPGDMEIQQEFIKSSKTRVKLTLQLVPEINKEDKSILVMSGVPNHYSQNELKKRIAGANNNRNVGKRAEKTGSVWNVYFISVEAAEHFKTLTVPFGTVVSTGKAISSFFRVTGSSKDIREGHEDRIIDSVKDQTKIPLVSVTINTEKKCVTLYAPSLADLAKLCLTTDFQCLKIKNGGPLVPSYFIYLNPTTAASSDSETFKFLIKNVSNRFNSESLYSSVCATLANVIPEEAIIMLSIYLYPDTGKQANFAFMLIEGLKYAELLENIEIPTPFGDPLLFSRATERKAGDSDYKPGKGYQ